MLTSKRKKGFTLVEVLISLAAFGILMTALFSFYMAIRGLVFEQTHASQSGNRAINAIKIITRDFQNLVYEPYNSRYFFIVKEQVTGEVKTVFLNFLSGSLYSNPSLMQSSVYNVTYFGQKDEEASRVDLYRSEDIFADFKNTTGGIKVPLLENIAEFTAEFSLNTDDWRKDWDMTLMKKPPRYIRITLKWYEEENLRTFQSEISPGIFY